MTNFVTVEGRALKQAMKLPRDVIERRNTIPVLSHVRLTLTADGLRVSATDLDVLVSTEVDVIDGQGEWSICVDAGVLDGIARVAGVMPVRITPDTETGAAIDVGDGAATYDVKTLPADDFPDMAAPRAGLIETFSNGAFAEMLDKVSWCVSTEETRYYLNGVCWQINGNGRRFVATDGHRLAACRYSKEEAAGQDSRIIPRKSVALISRHFAGKDVKIFATEKDHLIEIVSPGVLFRTKLIDGTFPDVDRVIVRDADIKFEFDIDRNEISTAIDKAMVMDRNERHRALRFANDNGRMTLSRTSVDFGTAKVPTSVKWPEGAETFAFNSHYISEVAAKCLGKIRLRMIDTGSPFSIADEDETMTRILMPMRA